MIEETTPETTQHKPTLQERMEELQAWLDKRGLVPVIVAVGRKSGQLAAIDDFMPETHGVTLILREKHANSTG